MLDYEDATMNQFSVCIPNEFLFDHRCFMPSKREITLQYDLFFNIPGNKIWIINILVQLQDILILKLIVNFIFKMKAGTSRKFYEWFLHR